MFCTSNEKNVHNHLKCSQLSMFRTCNEKNCPSILVETLGLINNISGPYSIFIVDNKNKIASE